MRSQFISNRLRSSSLGAVPPLGAEYSTDLADVAGRILYRSPLPSHNDLPVYILNGAALPDSHEADYDSLLPYVLARLPDEEELIGGKGYEVVFFAGGEERSPSSPKKGRPGWGWFLQAYHVLSRAMRKRLQKLYLVHERRWIRVMTEMFSTIVSPKFRKKICHVSSLSALALQIPIEDLLIPPSAYHYDRRLTPDIYVPYATGRRAFGVRNPLPVSSIGGPRLPRILRETTSFLLTDNNVRTEGIFRVNARAVTVGILKEAYDRGQKFIIWKEGYSALAFSHWKEGHGDIVVDDLQYMEGFGITAAAALIKLWYAQLQQPIFPRASYAFLERTFGDTATPLEISTVFALVGECSDWSPLSKDARQVLTMHLLPLLALMAENQDWNKMTPHNLALCFAPSLLYGSDPVEDSRIANIVRRIIQYAIEQWSSQLSTMCGMDKCKFEEWLRIPELVVDREDPLDSRRDSTNRPLSGYALQTDGIVMMDIDDSDDGEEEDKPPLPPRINTTVTGADDAEEVEEKPPLPPRINTTQVIGLNPDNAGAVRRKPAPSVPAPPRYSTIITRSPSVIETLPVYTIMGDHRLDIASRSQDEQEEVGHTNINAAIRRKPTSTAVSGS